MQKFEEREWLIFENNGQKIFGMIHKPISDKKIPAVVMCHGFAGNKIGKYRIYVQLAQKLAKNGIASLRFDFRGSGDSEGEFSDMTIDSEVSDALQALQILRKDPQIDVSRTGLLGNSFGGAIAVLAAQKDKNVKSLALLAPLFSSQAWQQKWAAIMSNKADENSGRELQRILEGYMPGPSFFPGFMKLNLEQALTELNHVPLLHIHSIKDERVTVDQAEQYKKCRKDTAETRWIRLEKCDHDFCNPEERNVIVQEVAEWFKKTL